MDHGGEKEESVFFLSTLCLCIGVFYMSIQQVLGIEVLLIGDVLGKLDFFCGITQ